jgi:hypothetical protein
MLPIALINPTAVAALDLLKIYARAVLPKQQTAFFPA